MEPEIVKPPRGWAFACRFRGASGVCRYDAEEWLRARGYSCGSIMHAKRPVAVQFGVHRRGFVAQWNDMSAEEQASMSGVILEDKTTPDSVIVRLRKLPADLVR